jgi:hypothetical protein
MSSYKQKQKGKQKFSPAVLKPFKKVPPVFDYLCECHGLPAKKKPLTIDKATDFKDRNKLEHSLGTFNCSVTRKKVKVSRVKHKEEDAGYAVLQNPDTAQQASAV